MHELGEVNAAFLVACVVAAVAVLAVAARAGQRTDPILDIFFGGVGRAVGQQHLIVGRAFGRFIQRADVGGTADDLLITAAAVLSITIRAARGPVLAKRRIVAGIRAVAAVFAIAIACGMARAIGVLTARETVAYRFAAPVAGGFLQYFYNRRETACGQSVDDFCKPLAHGLELTGAARLIGDLQNRCVRRLIVVADCGAVARLMVEDEIDRLIA